MYKIKLIFLIRSFLLMENKYHNAISIKSEDDLMNRKYIKIKHHEKELIPELVLNIGFFALNIE